MTPDEVLSSFTLLSSVLLEIDEDECRKLLKAEMRGHKRSRYALRIHGRLNRLRANRERREIIAKTDQRAKSVIDHYIRHEAFAP